jgi:hypothetical protein
VELGLFDQVADLVLAMVPPELGPLRHREHRYGIKAWFGAPEPASREHYEAQVIGAKGVEGARTLALEIGFHAEHRDDAENDRVIEHLQTRERAWRKQLGPEAVVGAFLGQDAWRRVSETWPDPDLSADDVVDEIAARLADYVIALEPVRRAR